MSTNRKISILLGTLIIISFISGILSSVPALEKADYLSKLAADSRQVLTAVLFQGIMAAAYTLIAALFYPVIRRFSENAAIAYFSFRIIATGILYLGMVTLLALLFLSRIYVSGGTGEAANIQALSELFRLIRDWLNHGGVILPWSIGSLILYYTFFRMELIPSWLSVWGMIGSILTAIITITFILGYVEITSVLYFAANTPTAFFELTLAVYLFVKGFNLNWEEVK